MDDINKMIYDELVELRQDFKEYIKSTDDRLSSLESFKNKALGGVIVISCVVGYAIDYIRRII